MTEQEREARVIQLGEFALDLLGDSENWGPDELEAISNKAHDLALAENDENGFFRKVTE